MEQQQDISLMYYNITIVEPKYLDSISNKLKHGKMTPRVVRCFQKQAPGKRCVSCRNFVYIKSSTF